MSAAETLEAGGRFHSGFVTFVGRPNAGKSTLLNRIVGRKIAITSSTAQTTRHRLTGVRTTDTCQLVIVDTPGLHKPHDALGQELNESALQALDGVDCVAFLLDASKPAGRGDEWVAQHVARLDAAKILVVNKADLVEQDVVDAQVEAARPWADWDAVCVLSARTGAGVDEFVDAVSSLLPEGPHWFPADMDTDQPEEVMVAEFIREKILRSFRDEVPHAIGVAVEEMEYVKRSDLMRIYALIYVEHDSQKGIIIGKGGQALKEIGTQARADLESLLGCRVFLDLRVKVKKNWRRDVNQIRRFGYGQGI